MLKYLPSERLSVSFWLVKRGKTNAPVYFPDLRTRPLSILTPIHDPSPYQPSLRIRRLRNSLLSTSDRSLLLLLLP